MKFLNAPFIFSFRCNTDGSVRWVYPQASHQPDFLRFYHRSQWKALAFVAVVRILFFLRLQRFFKQGDFTLYTNPVGLQMLSPNADARWALFTGTIGPNRKLILWQGTKTAAGIFTKIAITPSAAANILSERKALTQVAGNRLSLIEVPKVIAFDAAFFTQSDVAVSGVKRTSRLSQLPIAALQQWLMVDKQLVRLSDASFLQGAQALLTDVEKRNDDRIPKQLAGSMKALLSSLPINATLPVTTAHGDFTPWNVFYNNDKLCLIDWELSGAAMPALFDLFHFIYQRNILIGNNGYKAIRTELDALFAQPEWKSFTHRHQLNVMQLEQAYLVSTATYYLELYSRQAHWHTQVTWLIKTWTEATTFHLYTAGTAPARQLLLTDLQLMLQPHNYAVLKLMVSDLTQVPETSDIDICITKQGGDSLIRQLKNHPLVNKINIVRRTHLVQLAMVLVDGTLLHLDFIQTIKRKSLTFIPAENLLASVVTNEAGIKVPSAAMNFLYTWLFYSLNKAGMPLHYQKRFMAMAPAEKQEMDEVVQMHLPLITLFEEVFAANEDYRRTLISLLKNVAENKGYRGLVNKMRYGFDTLLNTLPRKGCVITFSGVDGAGKSTIIEKTKTHIEKCLRGKAVVIRHRPSLLPILSAYKYGKAQAEQKAAGTLPRQGSNKSKWSSAMRFAYYYTDYALGQFYVQVRYVWQGYTVLYDRYYFDFINDSKRSNITLPKAFTAWCYRFLLKPRLNFFLYAQPEEILKRKKELDAPTITLLTKNYLQLFNRLSTKYRHSKYLPVHNTDLSTTLDFIFQNIKTVRS